MKVTLRAARVNAGLNQAEAAEKLGVSRDTVRHWENAESYPTVPQIIKLEQIYGVSYDNLIFLPETTLKA